MSFFEALCYNYGYYRHEGDNPIIAVWDVIYEVVVWYFNSTVCKLYDHNWKRYACDPENGYEYIECQRCGHGENIYH